MSHPQRLAQPSRVIAARRIGGHVQPPLHEVEVVNHVLPRAPAPSWASSPPSSRWARIQGWLERTTQKAAPLLEAPIEDMEWMWRNAAAIVRSLLLLMAPLAIAYAIVQPADHLPPVLKITTFVATSVLCFVVMAWALFLANKSLDVVGRWVTWCSTKSTHSGLPKPQNKS